METPKDHIAQIRRNKFSIGASANPLTEDLHQAVKNLSAELYAKDVHFLMEIIQNAEDNVYSDEVRPKLEFVITSKDITGTGAPATLLIFNNEMGFTSKNIESICSVGRSTKKGNRKSGYIGEKGIGFKSVFLITAQPHIFSNGYQIRFNEAPCPYCSLGFIVPEWVDESQILSNIKGICGSTILPTTVMVLPLKPDKVKPVKMQLSSIHPEVLLFLSKTKRLSVREDNENPKLSTVSSIAIESETDFETRKNLGAKSYTLRLSAEEQDCKSEQECSYYMWQQTFSVNPEDKVERRMDIDEFIVTLAFPNEERLHRGTSLPGVYAFLPTEMVTNFPFIIQADFVLSSSRETIRLDDKWNRAILDCIPSAFCNAFASLVKIGDNVPPSSLSTLFKFVPVRSSSYQILNDVREKIRKQLVQQSIIPCESYNKQTFFYKPCEVGRLDPAFWEILEKAWKQGLSLLNISSHGKYILSSALDTEEYDEVLKFLGVEPVDADWYAKCIQSSNLVERVTDDIYLDLLSFVADNWSSKLFSTSIANIPLIKYVDYDGRESLCSIKECTQRYSPKLVCRSCSHEPHVVSWLICWNKELRCAANRYFMPSTTQKAVVSSNRQAVLEWLENHAKVAKVTVNDFAVLVVNSINSDKKLAIIFAHFLYQSFSRKYLSNGGIECLRGIMPLVDNYGEVLTPKHGILVPANQSKWAKLLVSNPWRNEGYTELSEEYLHPLACAGVTTQRNGFMHFLQSHILARDIPEICPPNAGFSSVSGPLSIENAFLLLDWIQFMRFRGISIPDKFLASIKNGGWLRVVVNGSCGWRAPSESFLFDSSLEKLLQNGSVLVDIPLVDHTYYGSSRFKKYQDDLKLIGVMFGCKEACEFIGKRLASSYTLTRERVLSILNFIRFLHENFFPSDSFVNSVIKGRWLRTKCGERSPVGAVLFDSQWQTAAQISDIPFVDSDYYGVSIKIFKRELKLLGVVVDFTESYQLIIDYLKPTSHLTNLSADAILLMLKCIHSAEESSNLVSAFASLKCLRTSMGLKPPGECFLSDPVWGCILKVFSEFPVIDEQHYGRCIFNYKNELKKVGVTLDFENAIKKFINVFKKKALEPSVSKESVVSFLSCCEKLEGTPHKFPSDFNVCLRTTKWLWTRKGHYVAPRDCILFSPEWAAISLISDLPFIDDTGYYHDESIHEFKGVLKRMGVITKLEDGLNFVAKNLNIPLDPSSIVLESVFSLLECVRLMLKEKNQSLLEDFVKRLCTNLFRTHAGYMPPENCLLFDSKWNKHLEMTDGPFLDIEYYGSKIGSYRKELNAIGVIVDADKGCSLVASNIELHSEHSVIVRIYTYLSEYKWNPNCEDAKKIWIPIGFSGKWVSPEECVLHDKDDLFNLRLNVLEKFYDKKLLPFLSSALDVKSQPSVADYFELWKEWECSKDQLSHVDCCKFWKFMLQHWNKKTEKTLADGLSKLPVAASGSDGVYLLDKKDVLIVDDLQLMNLFQEFSPLFVWYPQPNLPSLPRDLLLEIYRNIGVRTISEAVKMEGMSEPNGVEHKQVVPAEILIGEGLCKLILGFLSGPTIKMEAEKRHEAVKGLCNLIVHETTEPISVSYSISLPSRDKMHATTNRMVRWERGSSVFFTQKLDLSISHNLIRYATYFSEAIAEGVLRDKVEHIRTLSELIKCAFILKFDESALKFQMDSDNLQIFKEDEEFLNAAFH